MFLFKNNIFYTFKKLNITLMKIKGLGLKRAEYLCGLLGYAKKIKIMNINTYRFNLIKYLLDKSYAIDIYLMQKKENKQKKFLSHKSYKSIKYMAGLPIRGQRTHGSANTAKKLHKRNRKF